MNEKFRKFRKTTAFKFVFLWLIVVFSGGLYLRFSSRTGGKSQAPQVVHLAERLAVVAKHSQDLSPELRTQLSELAVEVEQDENLKSLIQGELKDEVEIESLTPGYKLLAEQIMEETPERTEKLGALAQDGETRFLITACLLGTLGLCCVVSFLLPKPKSDDSDTEVAVLLGPLSVLTVFFLWDVLGFYGGGIFAGILRMGLGPFLTIFAIQFLLYGFMFYLLRSVGFKVWESLKAFNWSWVGKGYLLCLATVMTVNIAISTASGSSPQSENPVLGLFLDAPAWKVGMLGLLVVVVGPFFEELMFRGWLVGQLSPKWGEKTAIILSAALFAAIHGDLPGLPALFGLGLVFGWVYRRSGSLLASIIVHGMWNATTFSLLISVMP